MPNYTSPNKITSSTFPAGPDLRRYGSDRRSRVETLAVRKLKQRHGLSDAHARVISQLQNYGAEGANE